MSIFRFIWVTALAVSLTACGGGGGSSGANPNQPTLVSTAGDTLIVPVGSFREYKVSGGVPPYQASSSDAAIAVGSMSGGNLSIGALAGGKATIRVFDTRGASVSTEVTVGSSTRLYTTAPSALNIGINVTQSFVIGGGAPPYTVTGSNASVATVMQTGAATWSITGVAANASGTVLIRDSAGATVEVAVTTNPPPIRISPDKLTMPAGMEAQVTVSGGQPPYFPAGGIPAAIAVTPAVSQDGKFKIVGNLASKLDVTFVDSAGQSVKVEVEVNTATVSFRLSPSPISVNENSTDELTFSLFGFHGDAGTAATSGSVCIYVSDPSYLTLDPSRTTCSTFSSQNRSFKLVTGSRGRRCVSADTPVQIRAVDSMASVALGTVTILDVGTACVPGSGATGVLTLTPNVVTVAGTGSSTVLISGGSGGYLASVVSGPVTASLAGNALTVTRTAAGVATVRVVDLANPAQTVDLTVN